MGELSRAKPIKIKNLRDDVLFLEKNTPKIINHSNNSHVLCVEEEKENEKCFIHSLFNDDAYAIVAKEFYLKNKDKPKRVDVSYYYFSTDYNVIAYLCINNILLEGVLKYMASKSRRKNQKFHWTKELIFLLAGIVVLIVAAVIVNIPTAQNRLLSELNTSISSYNSSNSTSYNSLTEDTQCFKYITLDGLKKEKKNSGYTYVLYGALSDGTTLENLSAIGTSVHNNDYVSTVYFLKADFVIAAKADSSYSDSYEYNQKISAMEETINGVDESEVIDSGEVGLKDSYALDLEEYPALLVFKNNMLIFNSQAYENGTWNNYIEKAFSYQILEEGEAKNVTPTATSSN